MERDEKKLISDIKKMAAENQMKAVNIQVLSSISDQNDNSIGF